MKKSIGLILGLFFLWGAGSTYWYVCKIKGFCSSTNQEVSAQPVEGDLGNLTEKEEIRDYLYFPKNSYLPIINDTVQWKAEVESLKKLQEEGKKLFIYGPYHNWEKSPEDYENLGMARAESLKDLISTEIDTSFIFTRSRLLDNENEVDYISGINDIFQWKTYNDFVKEELPQSVFIYFPYNSNQEIKIKEIVSYLDDLAERLKENSEMKIQIIGHTDNIGNEESNMELSKKRAKRIASILVNKGVPSSQIETIGKGESEPISDNATKNGRKLNRRVEIKIIK